MATADPPTAVVPDRQHLQVLRAMAWLYRREMRRLGFDRRAWGQGRLRLVDELVGAVAAVAGEAVEQPETPLPPLGTTYELTPRGAAELYVAHALDRRGTVPHVDPGVDEPPPQEAVG